VQKFLGLLVLTDYTQFAAFPTQPHRQKSLQPRMNGKDLSDGLKLPPNLRWRHVLHKSINDTTGVMGFLSVYLRHPPTVSKADSGSPIKSPFSLSDLVWD
jgi:hypothetical protein